MVVEKEPVKVVPDVPKKAQEKEAIEEERESELEESSDDDYKPRPVNIMTYPARTKRSMLRRSAPLQSTTDESMPNSPVSVYVFFNRFYVTLKKTKNLVLYRWKS